MVVRSLVASKQLGCNARFCDRVHTTVTRRVSTWDERSTFLLIPHPFTKSFREAPGHGNLFLDMSNPQAVSLRIARYPLHEQGIDDKGPVALEQEIHVGPLFDILHGIPDQQL